MKNNFQRRPRLDFFVFGLIVYFLFLQLSIAGLPKNNPVPGGVAVVSLSELSQEKPSVRFGNKKIAVIPENSRWIAVVGLPQEILPGKYILTLDSSSDNQSKKYFRVDPLPASQSQQAVTIPDYLSSLEFAPLNVITQQSIFDSSQNPDISIEAQFIFQQIVNSGSYLPYGYLLRQQSPVTVIEHPWITYITNSDELVRAPSPAIVEQIYLAEFSGLNVVLNHGTGLMSIVSYLNDTILKPGDSIKSGDIIGTTKTISDLSIGRVDWRLMLNGNFVDPLQFSPSP